ncbi:MAG: hypothetical protein R2744_07865 [Bacteroidales bacterium]
MTIAIFSTVILVVYASLVMGGQSRKIALTSGREVEILDLRAGYDAGDAETLFISMGDAGLAAYRSMALVWDNIFPLVYTLVYISWFSILFGTLIPEQSVFRRINMLPLLALLSDWLENTLVVNMIDSFTKNGRINNLLASAASFSTIVKWMIAVLLVVIFVTGLIILLFRIAGRGRK